jgi:hypothetical protein
MSARLIQPRLAFHQAVTSVRTAIFGLGQLARVHLKAHMPLRRHPGAEADVEHPARCVAARGPDMGAGHHQRQEQRRIVLHLQAFQRVIGIRQPDPLGALIMPKSMRPPPEAQLSISTSGKAPRSRSISA